MKKRNSLYKKTSKDTLISNINKYLDIATINKYAKETKFSQRKGKLNPIEFLYRCIFMSIDNTRGSLNDICRDLFKNKIAIQKQSLNERFNKYAVLFLKKIVSYALSQKLNFQQEIQTTFKRIIIGDSTVFQLPEIMRSKYRGNGGGASEAAIKTQFCYDLINADIIDISIYEGRNSDKRYPLQDIRENDLRIEDLGYFKIDRFKEIQEAKAFFLSRFKFGIKTFVMINGVLEIFDIMNVIKKMKVGEIKSFDVYIGDKEKFRVRLVLEKVPSEISNKKRRKFKTDNHNKRKSISKERLVFCDVNAYITNCNEEQIPDKLIRPSYGLRWQIEIIFKAWKSYFKIDEVKKMKLERFECLFYGSLLLIIISTQLLTYIKYKHTNKYKNEISELKYFKFIVSMSNELKCMIKNKNKTEIAKILEQIEWMVEKFCIKEQKKNKPIPSIILRNLS